MTAETYIPTEVSFAGRRIEDVCAVTLHDADSNDPHGSLTTQKPLREGERGGPLVMSGTRYGKVWQITLPEIEVIRRTPVGCEFIVYGRLTRSAL